MSVTHTVIEMLSSFLKKAQLYVNIFTINKRIASIWSQIMITSTHDASSVT